MLKKYQQSPLFKRHFRERIAKNETLLADFIKNVEAFFENPSQVEDHSLEEVMSGMRAFRISNDCRVIYLNKRDGTVVFVDIGNHRQVYQRKGRPARKQKP